MAKTKTFVLHDESVNTRGFRMLTAGANIDEFIKNPVGLFIHNDGELPIIRWENIRKENGKILADPVFDEVDPKAAEVKGKVDRDFIRMASIGAWPPEEISDDPALRMPGQTLPTVTKWTVREASIVTIGSNHNAICFYDRKTLKKIDLADPSALIKLMDVSNVNKSNTNHMNELDQILKLGDNATDAMRVAAISGLISDRDRLKGENVTLTGRIDDLNKAERDKQKAEAVLLTDAAIKDGRLNASAKENTLQLFDKDFESTKKMLADIPVRKSVTRRIETSAEADNVELADLQKKSWDELDRAGKLTLLKDQHYDLYKEKFKARFGCEPNE